MSDDDWRKFESSLDDRIPGQTVENLDADSEMDQLKNL